ncbi:MAG: PHB depolymerase family esterase [Bacteroidia bacterium]|nr:PHB depolymerase family esterase [Bacteroidia bacterium]
MIELEDFGLNPGELKAFLHVPPNAGKDIPLVVAMHGCLQDAKIYAQETGWNEIADREGFMVLYPEQAKTNNPNNCFSWFLEGDINRDEGESRSIKSMIDFVIDSFQVDSSRLYVSGLSAGGCMTAVMLATYPELFQSGAVIAGVPYKASTTLEGALSAMKGLIDQEPDKWEELVLEQNPSYDGKYPNLVVFHGAEDPVVNRKNMVELAEQWMALHNIKPEHMSLSNPFDGNPNVTQRVYQNPAGKGRVVTFEVEKLGHALSVNPGKGPKQGGRTGQFAVDADFFVTYWAADFFDLIKSKN